ncbi:hypothetical protein QBC34DRAFT_390664 [Podospora aff. communis PSN243]|uniref:Uncharacterized protein n=1 Tax=Podospora aff. communis PSN243 TaxID=3040156 RepID=A0AAV9H4V5_9PEZI|nr:hypothetical protein QBC34DRAFT_390664 [Podospora aff. communis PSN243]
MAADDLTPTLRFLTDAGHLMATASPETSAFLMRKRDALMFEHEIPLTEAQRQHVCSCCGHIMIPGRGSQLEFRKEKKALKKSASTRLRQPQQPKSGESQPRLTKVITCGHCGRRTETKLHPPPPISRRSTKTKITKPLLLETAPAQTRLPQEDAPQKGTANASSKKRAKSRKAGLQALLATKGSNSGLGLGLGLSDFMQK